MNFNKELNHTASHLLAAAVIKLYPDVKLGFGPATKEGFYYDFEFSTPISDKDLDKIEKLMKKLASGGYKMESVDGQDYDFSDKPYKKELFDELKLKNANATFYALINPADKTNLFTDLCAGGHVDSTKYLKNFKLLSIAGAYWRGNSDNIQLTRIYGTAWDTPEELTEFLHILQDRKERDHRKIGKELEIFTFNHLSGQGLPIWLPDGMKIRNAIRDKVVKWDREYGFKEVLTPHFGEQELYEISGHWQHYKDDMFNVLEVENEKLVPRPMTCPHHIILFKRKGRSYRELPIRYSELSRLYRYEKSGALTGLERVRGMDLTEGHVFARISQIKEEFKHQYELIKHVLDVFNIEIDYVSFSTRDPENKEKFFDNDKFWEKAESDLKQVLDELKLDYVEVKGEAAFYGPKIDIQIKTVLGHEITMSTLQLDFLLPERFKMEYINEHNEKEMPILIHRGLIGTYERFISILLEQTKGVLPFWLSPKQVTVIPVNNELHWDYANKVNKKLFALEFHSRLDDSEERINKKIRNSQIQKVKYQVVVGDEEIKNNTITYREYGKQEENTVPLNEFIAMLEKLKKEMK